MAVYFWRGRPSRGARELARALGCRLNRLNGSRMSPKRGDLLVNWGSTELPERLVREGQHRLLNMPDKVQLACNKLLAFQEIHRQTLDEPILVPWTSAPAEAQEWLDNDHRIIVRTKLRAHSGEGIVVVEPGEVIPNAPLYTQYVKGWDEYRVHVFGDEVIDLQQKRRRTDYDGRPDPVIRTHPNGWVFCREGVTAPGSVHACAVLAVRCLGLDFGAVDVKYNTHMDRAFVLEVNTAPGLEGTTIQRYADAIRRAAGVGQGE